jgi:hypothetical protein
METFEEAGDVGAAPAIGSCREAEEAHPQLAVPHALEGLFAAEDGGEQGEIGGRRGIERTRRAPAEVPHRLHEALEGAIGGRRRRTAGGYGPRTIAGRGATFRLAIPVLPLH